jgi:predicted glutamine amidotransferase
MDEEMKVEGVQLTFAHNGVIVEFDGKNAAGEWCRRKEVFPTWITASERAQIVWQSRFDGSVFQDCDIDL